MGSLSPAMRVNMPAPEVKCSSEVSLYKRLAGRAQGRELAVFCSQQESKFKIKAGVRSLDDYSSQKRLYCTPAVMLGIENQASGGLQLPETDSFHEVTPRAASVSVSFVLK